MDKPVGIPIKDQVKNELSTLRAMSLKQKREYIWEYYRALIIGTIIFLIVAGSLINTWFINPPKGTALLFAWNSGYETDEYMRFLADALTERLVENPGKEEVAVMSFLSGDDPSMVMATSNRLMAMLTAGEIDVFFLDDQLAAQYSEIEFILPMEDFLQAVLAQSPGVYEQIKDKLLLLPHRATEDSPEENLVFGIQVGRCPLFREIDIYEQDLYFCLAVTSKNTDTAVRALIAFYE